MNRENITTTHPELCLEWHKTKNNNMFPKNFSYGSEKNIWWKCKKCSHEWKSTITNRTHGRGCPACAGKITTKTNSLITKQPHICEEWHQIKNKSIGINTISYKSNKKVWWKCKQCNYEWETSPNNRANGRGCPNCANRIINKHNSLKQNYPNIYKELYYSQDDLFSKSNKRVWWKCQKCNYKWKTSPSSRTRGTGCPSCSGRVANNNNSLQNNLTLCEEFHLTKNILKPEEITENSGKKVWWKCKQCSHEWKAIVASRNKGHGCPKCAKSGRISKSGSKWLDKLKIPNENREVSIKINGKLFIVDGFDFDTNTIYEYLGSFWHGNPQFYDPQDINPINKKTFGELYYNTIKRFNIFKQNDYNIVYKWGY